ncbi:hypothetical protein FJQ54_09330 [Sandaracinobacter neustonicus]|uniref:Phytase-like domain-containing protein n=1 Tax=Sandaracinobacter neustonicus TaxID=1715348 RepID=A0A501XKY9_9SPHN|nr:esterase-like activity of phytase family protein [Sandaracinobacter neustonicus]TPE61089.1 hypothetical protein FJQ54_09330 [Sandaracinobacter neustonicus]
MTRIRRAIPSAAAIAAGAVLGVYFAGPALGAGPVTPIEVQAKAIPLSNADPAQDRVGRLRYMGGLVLSANNMRFGGISDMLWEPECNRLLAVTDAGSWVILEPREQDGRLTGVSAGWIAPIKGPDGMPPVTKSGADAEGVTRTTDGRTWVSYEQAHRLERFADVSGCRPESLDSTPDRRWVLPAMAGWPENGGAEAIAADNGRVVILAEEVSGPGGGILGLSADPEAGVQQFGWQAPKGYAPTAIGRLDDGADGFVVLHRRFTPIEGVSAVISQGRIPADPAKLPELVQSTELARLRPPLNVDNMEALAIRKEGERRYLYIMSDNNFNALQRTLLLKFELLPEADAKP